MGKIRERGRRDWKEKGERKKMMTTMSFHKERDIFVIVKKGLNFACRMSIWLEL